MSIIDQRSVIGARFRRTVRGGQTTGDGDGDSTGDGDGDPTGGPDDDWNPCLALIECAKTVEPSGVSTLAQLHGIEGTCYDVAGLTKEDCWAECEGIRQQKYASKTFYPECAHFQCNNGILDATEMCDGDESTCNPHCTLQDHECNPLTQVPCDGQNEGAGWGSSSFMIRGGTSPPTTNSNSGAVIGRRAPPA